LKKNQKQNRFFNGLLKKIHHYSEIFNVAVGGEFVSHHLGHMGAPNGWKPRLFLSQQANGTSFSD